MIKIENVIFDFDGTLIDSQIDIQESFQKAIFQIKGVVIESSTLKIGPPLEEMIKAFIPQISTDETSEIVNAFRFIYSNCGFNKTFCYDGITDILTFLKRKNISIFIATNKPKYLTEKIIEKLDINLFESVCTIDHIPGSFLTKKEMVSLLINKYGLKKETSLMVGDSVSDVYAAKGNDITSVGIGYGYETKEHILEAKPNHYFNNVAEFADFLKRNHLFNE